MTRCVYFVLLCVLTGLCGCSYQQVQEEVLFDKTYASYCDVIDDIVEYTLKNHAFWSMDDFDHLTSKAVSKFNKILSAPLDLTGEMCDDLRMLFENQEEAMSASKVDFYRAFMQTYMKTLDAHSRYVLPSRVKTERDQINGQSKTSGVEFFYRNPDIGSYSSQNTLWVDYLHDDAYPTLQVGDQIQEIFGIPVLTFAWKDIADLVKGKNTIAIKTSNGEIEIDRFRSNYPSFYVNESNVDGALIVWVRLMEFTRDSISALTAKLDQYKHADAIIMDLRGNPGGLLIEVESLLDYFLPAQHIYSEVNYSRGRIKKIRLHAAQQNNLPLYVFIDSGSASASEIFAGAIQIAKRGTLIGNYTFGKMSAQTPYRISEKNGLGGMIALTKDFMVFSDRSTAQWHRVSPDVWFKDPEVEILQSNEGEFYEHQLEAALKPSESPPPQPRNQMTIEPCEINDLRDCTHKRILGFARRQLH